MNAAEMCAYWDDGHNARLPDPGFVADLHTSFPEAVVRWDNAMERWQICEKNRKGRLVEVMLVQGLAGEYRDLGFDVIEHLHEMDTHFGAGKKAFVQDGMGRRQEAKQAAERARGDLARDFAVEAGTYLHNCPEHKRGF